MSCRLGRRKCLLQKEKNQIANAVLSSVKTFERDSCRACFSLTPNDFRDAIATAIWQGGDTDTIAAMTGALVGAHIGSQFADSLPLERLEDGPEFITYLRSLAERL